MNRQGMNLQSNTEVAPAAAQCKSTIGQNNGIMEHRADAMTDKIMRMPITQNNAIQRRCNHCEEEENDGMAQRKPLVSFIQKKEKSNGAGTASDAVTNQINATKSGGSDMDNQTLSFMESRFGTSFQDVRIHTGDYASNLSRQLNAQAFTVGNDVYFNQNKYAPNTNEGKHLLAHELTHTIQQNNDAQRKLLQRKQELTDDPPGQYQKCLNQINVVITKLEANAGANSSMPNDIKEATVLLRKKFTDKKIKCYIMDDNHGGETNFTTGEIYIDAKTLEGSPDVFANIGEGTVLHEGIHALHAEKYPNATKKYGKALDDKHAGKAVTISKSEDEANTKLDAWTEYWAYRKMIEYQNIKNKENKDEFTINKETIQRMREGHVYVVLHKAQELDPNFDPIKWHPPG